MESSHNSAFLLNDGVLSDHATCPGLYCGRMINGDSVSECGACPRGYRANASSICEPCSEEPLLYDWLYLGFMILLPLVLHWFFIDMVTFGRKCFTKVQIIATHMCAFIEVLSGLAITLFISEPKGTFQLWVCSPKALSDWYTLFHNPQPGYRETLHCTQEAVYPLYTVVLLIYMFSLVMMILLRPWLLRFTPHKQTVTTIYCALYFFPALMFIHAVAAGLIYYSFPHIIIILSMMSSASHFSVKEDQTALALLTSCFKDTRNAIILMGHWLMHAYGLISITGLKEPLFHSVLICLVPTPALFYILTAQFTDPMKIHND